MSDKTEKKKSQKQAYDIPIRLITSNTNPRYPLSKDLEKRGYNVLKDGSEMDMWALATSTNPAWKALYVNLINEGDPVLKAMASTMLSQGQLQDIELREGGTGKYHLVFGCRRCLAILYNHCVLGKPAEPTVRAVLVKGNENNLMHRSIIENTQKRPSHMEEALAFKWAINNGESKEDLAKQHGYSVQTIANRLALTELPVDQQKKIHEGRLSPTKALAEKHPQREKQPALRKRKEIEEAMDEYNTESLARKALEWVLCRREKIG